MATYCASGDPSCRQEFAKMPGNARFSALAMAVLKIKGRLIRGQVTGQRHALPII